MNHQHQHILRCFGMVKIGRSLIWKHFSLHSVGAVFTSSKSIVNPKRTTFLLSSVQTILAPSLLPSFGQMLFGPENGNCCLEVLLSWGRTYRTFCPYLSPFLMFCFDHLLSFCAQDWNICNGDCYFFDRRRGRTKFDRLANYAKCNMFDQVIPFHNIHSVCSWRLLQTIVVFLPEEKKKTINVSFCDYCFSFLHATLPLGMSQSKASSLQYLKASSEDKMGQCVISIISLAV